MKDMNLWMSQYVGEWETYSDAVFTRERVMNWLEQKEINEREAEILLRLTYEHKPNEREDKKKAYMAY